MDLFAYFIINYLTWITQQLVLPSPKTVAAGEAAPPPPPHMRLLILSLMPASLPDLPILNNIANNTESVTVSSCFLSRNLFLSSHAHATTSSSTPLLRGTQVTQI